MTDYLEEITILELQNKMESGELTAAGIAAEYLQRIGKLDRQGPAINSIIELNPDALAIAEALDKERRAGKVRGPLHGIPILLKDNIDTHDGMQTTAGSLALEGTAAPLDAFIVKRLRSAGAVILGKTNLSEWANFRGKHSSSGWSSRGGLTLNPYALDRTACGSSSGTAAAVAANLCAAGIGTETDGSIICPSQSNGIVGLKPTLGLASRSGIIPIAHSQDTAGPMARTVADAAILLAALTGRDPRDSATRHSRGRISKNYASFLDPHGLDGARLGVLRKLSGSNLQVTRLFESCLAVLRDLGAIVVDPVDAPGLTRFGRTELEVLHYEFKADMNRYLASRGPMARVRNVEELIRFNDDHKAEVMPYFGQEHLELAQKKSPLTSKPYREALAKNHRLSRTEGIDAVMRKHHLDALVVPSGGPAWLIDLVNGDANNWDTDSTSPAAVAGYPHITVPAGYIFGLPVGLSFFARAWQEPALIRMAFAFEQAAKVRRPPQFLPHAQTDENPQSVSNPSVL